MHRHRGSGFPDGSSYCLPQPRPVHRACHANCKKKPFFSLPYTFSARALFPYQDVIWQPFVAKGRLAQLSQLAPNAGRSQGPVLDLGELEDVFGVDRICVEIIISDPHKHAKTKLLSLVSMLSMLLIIRNSSVDLGSELSFNVSMPSCRLQGNDGLAAKWFHQPFSCPPPSSSPCPAAPATAI